ncbi:MAG: EthD family reductase [bacterium]
MHDRAISIRSSTFYQDEDVPAGDGLSSEYLGTFEAFEKLYHEEHVPMILDKLVGKTRFVATKVVGTSDGTRPPFYRIAEVHFPSLQTLRACARSDGGRKTLAHAVKISSGGTPLFLVAEETTFLFGTVSLWDWLNGIASRRRLRYSRAEVQ